MTDGVGLLTLSLILLVAYRHFLGPYFLYRLFYRNPEVWADSKIQKKAPLESKVNFDQKKTYKSLLIDVMVIFLTYSLYQANTLKLTPGFGLGGESGLEVKPFVHLIFYSVLIFNLLFFLQDLYFYLTHALLHQRKLYKYIHSVHHHSTNPTPWTSFSHHPIEGFIELLFYPMMLMFIPINFPTLLAFLFVTSTINFLGHSGFEIPALSLSRFKLFKWVATFTFHNRHHQYFNGNYSLYFNIWDRLFRTEIKTADSKGFGIGGRG